MVSLRRRRLLGLCSGLPDSSIVPSPMYFDDEGVAQFGTPPLRSTEKKQTKEIGNSSSMLDSISTMPQSTTKNIHDQEVKVKRRHRKKNADEKVRQGLRGVYFKNMKWQAAIKVDKKQIHLGTFGSQAEATRLYDRAAYMRGREPNFELTKEDKQELKKLEWDDFLEMTRLQISSTKTRKRRSGTQPRLKTEHSVHEGFLVSSPVDVA